MFFNISGDIGSEGVHALSQVIEMDKRRIHGRHRRDDDDYDDDDSGIYDDDDDISLSDEDDDDRW